MIRQGLERKTRGLRPKEKALECHKRIVRMAVKKTLDDFGIRDQAQRQRIHRIMKGMAGRINILKQWGKLESTSDAVAIGSKDTIFERYRESLAEELGRERTARKFYFKFLRSYASIATRLSNEENQK